MTAADWTSVDDTLPADGVDVLIATRDGLLLSSYNTETTEWYAEPINVQSCDVTHWRPLPKGPQ